MPERYKVIITDYVHDELAPEREVLGDIADVAALNAFSEEELAGRIEDAHAIMCYHHHPISALTIERLKQCRIIARSGVGVDSIDLACAKAHGIPVTNVPDYGTEEVADSALALALSLARGTHAANSRLRAQDGPWDNTQVAPLPRLRGRVFAIVGLGRIGTASAKRAKAIGFDVVFYDPYKEDGYDKALGIRRANTLRELLEQAYVVSAHCNLTDETRHILNEETIGWLPQGSLLVNTSRGAVVDTEAIPDALASGRLRGAAIDVLEGEPPDPRSALIQAWRDPGHAAHHHFILNPHIAYYCEEGMKEMRTKVSHECRRALLGEPLRNIVNGVETQ